MCAALRKFHHNFRVHAMRTVRVVAVNAAIRLAIGANKLVMACDGMRVKSW